MNGSHKAPKTKNPTSNPIRVLHLIDSLALGGAERMAVNLCNVLAESGCEMHLCATRLSGPMQEFISPNVRFLELKKKSTFDVSAIWRLRKYIRKHDIQIIHAHSSSFFMGCMIKWLTDVRLMWHDHYGDSEKLKERRAGVLRLLSRNFDKVFSVNELLRQWAANNLHVEANQIVYLQNFPSLDNSIQLRDTLPGEKEKRIVCAARLHRQKDHMTLVRSVALVHQSVPDVHLLLVGQDLLDDYSFKLKALIKNLQLDQYVHLLGGRTDITAILNECSIGVLSSESEGLPVSLLEYGLMGLAVVCTDVGECGTVLGNGKFGKVVPAKNPEALASALLELLSNTSEREALGHGFHEHVEQNYSGEAIASEVKEIYSKMIFND